MSAVYDSIAADYKKAKKQPWRLYVESFTLFDLVGDLTGKSVLDLACGEGYHTRALKRHGAARVVGVDVSPKMVELARQEEAREPLGIEYVVQDALSLALAERFDLVTATYLFNYARTPEELAAMARSVSSVLEPGGRLVGVNDNVLQPVAEYGASKLYGFIRSVDAERREGTPIHYTFWVEGQELHFDNYYLAPETYASAFREAGLKDLTWHRPRVSPTGVKESGADYWTAFLEKPPVIFLEARR